MMGLKSKLQKQWRYIRESEPYMPVGDRPALSPAVHLSAAQLRGVGRGPAVLLHGIMPRCGTVYVGELLGRHPALYAYPRQLWEVPFLAQSGRVQALQQGFLADYEDNQTRFAQDDFLALFGAMWVGYLYGEVPAGQRLLAKMAGVQYLDRFFQMFPHEQLLLLVRDGRDVVQSTLKSWPGLGFINVCRRWQKSATMVLACQQKFSGRDTAYWLVRFEEVLADPPRFVQTVCERFGLPAGDYPYDQIATIPVKGSSMLRPEGNNLSWEAIQKPRQFNPVGRWQSWTWWQKTLFKQIAGQSLIQLGYAPDQKW